MTKDATEASKLSVVYNNAYHTHFDPDKLEKAMADSIEQDMDVFSSQEALDNQRAYYKVSQPFPSP